jgi:signal transduction histidine kinase
LRKRLEAVEGRAGVEARLVADEFVQLPRDVEQELYRIAQEALNNALKHAAADTVIVYLRQSNKSIELEIVDDGVGFDPKVLPNGGGIGLKNIRDRAENIGGSLIVSSQPGEGTSVKVTVQLKTVQDRGSETGPKS